MTRMTSRTTRALIVSILSAVLVATVTAQRTDGAAALLEAAKQKERIEGDLAGAIKLYQAIVERFEKSDRAAAATALLAMGEAYEKQGNVQASKAYERLVNEFVDQAAAVATARSRLAGAIRPSQALQNKRVELPGSWQYSAGPVSADGRYLPYIDDHYNLTIRDLANGHDRVLIRASGTFGSSGSPGTAVISRDGAQFAFSWCHRVGDGMSRVCELRVASVRAPSEARNLTGDAETSFHPLDWSRDGSEIAVEMRQSNTRRIGFVNARTGSVRPLKSVEWRVIDRAFISPDGLDLAFELQPAETSRARDVFVLSVDGSRELHVVDHVSNDLVVGWSPDGQQLLFASDRRGAMALWALPWANRKPRGEPQLVTSDLKGNSLGISRTGALFTQAWTSSLDVEVAGIDLATGRQTVPPSKVVPIGSSMNPAWSPDGSSLAYTTTKGDSRVIGIRSMATGTVRELTVSSFTSMQGLTWAPDAQSFFVSGADLRGRYGVYSIDVQSGAVAPIGTPIDRNDQLSYEGFFWSPDARLLYYHSQNGKIHQHNRGSGTSREVTRGPFGPISLSPDGRWIATSQRDEGATHASVVLVSTTDGEVRELLRLEPGHWINNVAMLWTPDGQGLLARKMLTADGTKSELWVVPINGTAPRKLDFDANRIASFAAGKMRLHPDGRQFAFVSGSTTPEVWTLEHFLPAATDVRK